MYIVVNMFVRFSLVFLLTFTSSTMFGQFIGFQDSTDLRVDDHYYQFQQGFCSVFYHYHFSVQGDTLIGQKTYKKVFRSSTVSTVASCPGAVPIPFDGNPPVYAGALLEDQTIGRTSFRYPNSSIDSLVFDVNWAVGDTIKGTIANNGAWFTPLIIHSIDSVFLNGQFHRRWNFTTTAPDCNVQGYWIEGIGSSTGLMQPACTNQLDWIKRYLVCAKLGQQIVFQSGYNSSYGCDLVNSIPVHPVASELVCFPNPASSYLTLKGSPTSSVDRVDILTLTGKLLRTIMISSPGRAEIELSIEDIPSGFYLLKAVDERGDAWATRVCVNR